MMRGFVKAAVLAFVTCIAALCICSTTWAAGGGGSSPGGSNPGTGPSAPATPLPAGFSAFYVVANGSDPTFQSYVTEFTARYLQALHGWANPTDPNPYLWMVSAPHWNQDTLANTCKADPNTIGGVVITFSAFYTDAYWLLYNAETLHVTPSFTFVSCVKGNPIVVTPTIKLHTEKSKATLTVPVAPITGIATLFIPSGSSKNEVVTTTNSSKHTTQTTTTTSTSPFFNGTLGLLIPLTIATSFSGNFGVFNPGHEALDAARTISIDAAVVAQNLCAIPTPNVQMANGSKMSDAMAGAEDALDPSGDARRPMSEGIQLSSYREAVYPSLRELQFLMQIEQHSYAGLPSIVSASPSPSPIPAVTLSVAAGTNVRVHLRVKPAHRPVTKPSPSLLPDRSKAQIALPLATMCKALGGNVGVTTATPRPRNANP